MSKSLTIRDKFLLTSDRKMITKIEVSAHGKKPTLHKICSSIDKEAKLSVNNDCYSSFEFV